jgi:hypothetical protein
VVHPYNAVYIRLFYNLSAAFMLFDLSPMPKILMQTSQTGGWLRKKPQAILLTGFVAGTLDIIAACLQFYIKTGRGPGPVLRYIASGVFGKKAYAGGTTMAAWGLLFHFIIAFGLTIFFYGLYPRVSWIGKNKWLAGFLYGIFAWVITTQVIVRLSAVQQGPFVLKNALIAMGILVICIGLPISLMANKHYLYKK